MSSAPANAVAAVSPEPLVRVASGFMAAKQLFAANEVGLFAALGDDALTADELGERAGIPIRSCRIVADALAALGILSKNDGRYANGEAAATYLSGRADSPLDLRPYLAFWNAISYPHWLSYAETVRTYLPAPLELAGREGTFFGGVQAYNSAHALMLAEAYDFGVHRRVLDLAGLSGAFLGAAIARHPELRGTFFAEPQMVEFARGGGEIEGVELVAGDPLHDELPRGHDAVLLEHVVHRYGPDDNRSLLARAREVVEPGGRLLVLDFFLDEGESERPLDALLAGEYLVIDGTIVHPEAEVRAWAVETGWRPLETLILPGSPRVLVAEAA